MFGIYRKGEEDVAWSKCLLDYTERRPATDIRRL